LIGENMSKTSDFANEFASNFPIEGTEWEFCSKILKMNISNENINVKYEIKLNISKIANKAEVWSGKHFVLQCSADTPYNLNGKLTSLLVKEIESKSTKEALKEANTGLCDYITSEFEDNGFEIINKAGNEEHGSYIVRGRSGKMFQIKATYKDSTVTVSLFTEDQDALRVIKKFELSDPMIEKVICRSLVEEDRRTVSDSVKNHLIKTIKQMVIGEIRLDEYENDWNICAYEDVVTLETDDGLSKLKFRVKDIILEEVI